MFILNQYNLTATAAAAAAGAVNNVNPSVITGATGNSAAADAVTPIVTNVSFQNQIISKVVALTIPAGGLRAGVNNYITVPTTQLDIPGIRTIYAAVLLGIYDPNSNEGPGAGATPSFIGMWDKTAANVNSLSIVAGSLILRIPTAQIALFSAKVAMIQLYYS